MRSARPKVLHPLAGRPMLLHIVDVALEATGVRPIVVLSPGQPAVREVIDAIAEVVIQAEPRGTGDALRSLPAERRDAGPVVVLYGDLPLLRAETIRSLVRAQVASGAACVLLTVVPGRPAGLGRVVRGSSGRVERVVEERDLPGGEPVPAECNAGVYVFSGTRLWPALEALSADNAQGEHYLTDLIGMLAPEVETVLATDPERGDGGQRPQPVGRRRGGGCGARLLEALMPTGVTVEDPVTTYVDAAVRVGVDTVLRPMTVLRGATVIGRMKSDRWPRSATAASVTRVRVGASVIDEAEIADGVEIGHFNRVRPGSVLESGVSLGTHAEVKNSQVGVGSHINHVSCVLDSDLGRDVNVGAGTITCNYDGRAKHRTAIGDGVFVGSNSSLVAPVRIGRGAYVAAASIVTRDVPEGALAVGRARQRNIEGWHPRERPEDPRP